MAFERRIEKACAVTFDATGALLFVVVFDRVLTLDSRSGSVLRESAVFPAFAVPRRAIASADGRYVLIARERHHAVDMGVSDVLLVDTSIPDGKATQLAVPPSAHPECRSLAFTPDGSLALGINETGLLAWSLGSGESWVVPHAEDLDPSARSAIACGPDAQIAFLYADVLTVVRSGARGTAADRYDLRASSDDLFEMGCTTQFAAWRGQNRISLIARRFVDGGNGDVNSVWSVRLSRNEWRRERTLPGVPCWFSNDGLAVICRTPSDTLVRLERGHMSNLRMSLDDPNLPVRGLGDDYCHAFSSDGARLAVVNAFNNLASYDIAVTASTQ